MRWDDGTDERPVRGIGQARYGVVSGKADASELAAALKSPSRPRPAIVISSSRQGPMVDPTSVARRLGAVADVYVISTTDAGYDFSDAMPDDSSVYGGAVRVYPTGIAWLSAPRLRSPLFMVYSEQEASALPEKLAKELADMAAPPSPPAPAPVREAPSPSARTATVVGFDGAAARVDLGEGSEALASAPGAGPLIPPSMLLSPGQSVSVIDEGNGFRLTGANTPADATDHAYVGQVLPAIVTSPNSVALFPGLEVRSRTDAPVGSVSAVRIELVGRADGKAWRVSPADPAESVDEALPYLREGKPWLSMATAAETATRQAEAESPNAVPEDAPAASPSPAPPRIDEDVLAALDLLHTRFAQLTADRAREAERGDKAEGSLTLLQEELDEAKVRVSRGTSPTPSDVDSSLRAQIAALIEDKRYMAADLREEAADADRLAAENSSLRRQIERLREAVRTERERANRARQSSGDRPDADHGALFPDPVQQFRYEVYVEWARRIPSASKAELPLADYELGEQFLESVAQLQGIDRAKIVAVAVEVLTGLAEKLPSRDMHRVREDLPGNSPAVEHPEHGTAWRVSLQTGTAGARRMHFWRSRDGKIILANVGLHDDISM